MPRRRACALAFALAAAAPAAAPAQAPERTADRVRTESGVDPTRIVSRAGLTLERTDAPGIRRTHAVVPELGVGRGRWAASLKWRWVSLTPAAGGATVDGLGDLTLSATWAALHSGPHALAVSADVVAPIGADAISGDAVSVTPAATYVYSTDSRLVFAVRPQYAFTVSREAGVPAQSLLGLRGFIAFFHPSGLFAVAEARVLQDLERDRTDFVVAPALGWNVGGGLTLATRAEFPLSTDGRERLGTAARAGVQVVF